MNYNLHTLFPTTVYQGEIPLDMKIFEHIKDENYRRMDNDTAFITDNSYLLEESKYDLSFADKF